MERTFLKASVIALPAALPAAGAFAASTVAEPPIRDQIEETFAHLGRLLQRARPDCDDTPFTVCSVDDARGAFVSIHLQPKPVPVRWSGPGVYVLRDESGCRFIDRVQSNGEQVYRVRRCYPSGVTIRGVKTRFVAKHQLDIVRKVEEVA